MGGSSGTERWLTKGWDLVSFSLYASSRILLRPPRRRISWAGFRSSPGSPRHGSRILRQDERVFRPRPLFVAQRPPVWRSPPFELRHCPLELSHDEAEGQYGPLEGRTAIREGRNAIRGGGVKEAEGRVAEAGGGVTHPVPAVAEPGKEDSSGPRVLRCGSPCRRGAAEEISARVRSRAWSELRDRGYRFRRSLANGTEGSRRTLSGCRPRYYKAVSRRRPGWSRTRK